MRGRNTKQPRGAIAILALLGVSAFAMMVFTTLSVLAASELRMSLDATASERTFYAAEAGINEAIRRLITNPMPGTFTLPTDLTDSTTVSVTIDPNPTDPYQRIVTSRATDATGKQRTLRITVNSSSYSGSFNYAVQSGQGGFVMQNNAQVIGDIYSNGNVTASNNGHMLGETWIAVGENQGTSRENVPTTPYAFGRVSSTRVLAQSMVVPTGDTPLAEIQLYLRRQSNPSGLIVRIVSDNSGAPGTNVVAVPTTIGTIGTGFSWVSASFAIPPFLISGQTYWIVLDAGGVNGSRYYEWDLDAASGYPGQAKKTSTFSGGSWSDVTGDFAFRTFGLGDTSVQNVEIGQSSNPKDLHAHTITNSVVWKDAYYSTMSGSTVHGVSHPNAPDPQPKPFPITENTIAGWKTSAEAAGVITGTHTVTGVENLGPTKIAGDLVLSNGANLTLTGNIWVTGNIIFDHPGSRVQLAASFGPLSGVLMADGTIEITNNTTVNGSGDPKSFLLVLSSNTSVEINNPAIKARNNSNAIIYYAHRGTVRIWNGVNVNSALGYYLYMDQNSTVTYNPNLQGFTFPPEPSHSFGTVPDTWQES
jgi:hypothetical protein